MIKFSNCDFKKIKMVNKDDYILKLLYQIYFIHNKLFNSTCHVWSNCACMYWIEEVLSLKNKNKKLNETIIYMHTFQLKTSKIINNIENKKFWNLVVYNTKYILWLVFSFEKIF